MFSRRLGGLEQAFLDYNHALTIQGYNVINITSMAAKINDHSDMIEADQDNRVIKLLNIVPWDIFSKWQLKKLVKSLQPVAIIAHGGRAINFSQFKSECPLIGVAHGYSFKRLKKCDYIIALTNHMRQYLEDRQFASSRITIIPNMLKIKHDYVLRQYKTPIVIGAIARLVKNKGIDIFIKSILILKNRGYALKVIIAGDGEEMDCLVSLTKNLGLDDIISFVGWVSDKQAFFKNIDIFCSPSIYEPFGIVIIESIEYSLPVVVTNAEGPSEIIRHEKDGLVCAMKSPIDLAQSLATLIENQDIAQRYACNAYSRLRDAYDINVVSKKLSNFIKHVIS